HQQQLFFGLEELIDGGLADPGRLGDGLYIGDAKALAGKHFPGGGENTVAALIGGIGHGHGPAISVESEYSRAGRRRWRYRYLIFSSCSSRRARLERNSSSLTCSRATTSAGAL